MYVKKDSLERLFPQNLRKITQFHAFYHVVFITERFLKAEDKKKGTLPSRFAILWVEKFAYICLCSVSLIQMCNCGAM